MKDYVDISNLYDEAIDKIDKIPRGRHFYASNAQLKREFDPGIRKNNLKSVRRSATLFITLATRLTEIG